MYRPTMQRCKVYQYAAFSERHINNLQVLKDGS
jgi:hypothetical protein